MKAIQYSDWINEETKTSTIDRHSKEKDRFGFIGEYVESLSKVSNDILTSYKSEEEFENFIVHINPQTKGYISHQFETNRAKFERLKDIVKEESAHISSPSEIAMLSSYQRIIGMGWKALPYILENLKQEPFHWFWALQAITGENPVDQANYGRMDKMAESWIEWGRERELIR